jgi:hypothetical protein
MSIRSSHKKRLREILETITYEGTPVTVTEHYQDNPSSYPYFYIQSGELSTKFVANRRYEYRYTYYITLAFNVQDAISQVAVDTLEESFIQKLVSESTRDGNYELWQDLYLMSVSEMGQSDVNITDNTVLKIFTIDIQTINSYN